MSASSSLPNGSRIDSFREMLPSWTVAPLAASIAIIPAYYGFLAKGALQTGEPIPRMTLAQALTHGVKAAPKVGLIVGTQMIAQRVFEDALKERGEGSDLATKLASTFFVSVVSAPPLAVFNAGTVGKTAWETLRSISPQKVGAIVAREEFFLFALVSSKNLGDQMKMVFGDYQTVADTSAFVCGAIGSAAGHPADTALTLWEKNMKLGGARQLWRGVGYKALAVGAFTVLFNRGVSSLSKREV